MKNYQVKIISTRNNIIDCKYSLDWHIQSPDEDYNIEVVGEELYNGLIPMEVAKNLAAEILSDTTDATHIHIDPNDGTEYTVDFVKLEVTDVDTKVPSDADILQMQIDDLHDTIKHLEKQKQRVLEGKDPFGYDGEDDDLPF